MKRHLVRKIESKKDNWSQGELTLIKTCKKDTSASWLTRIILNYCTQFLRTAGALLWRGKGFVISLNTARRGV